ncbi:MAG TPA: hypothetical protein VFX51_29565 [Solirubrobacteraceae bacterium]|nr:hypothetical protein [Solirubrobacteraceae bacterium]
MTFAFADPAANVYGIARLGLTRAERTGQALAILFADGVPVATHARGDVPVPDADVERLALPGLVTTVEDPLHRWTVRFDDDAGHAFALTFDAAGPPAAFDDTGGMEGHEQLCHVHGSVRLGDETRPVRALGQRGHMWGSPDWDRIDAARYVGAWLDDGSAVVLRAVRPAGASFQDEASWAAVLGAAGSLQVDEPRLSTTYDEEGRQQRASLELWVGEEDDYPRRAAGEVLCGSTLDLGRVRLDCAFLRWRMGGRSGIGRYDLLRRA